MGLTEDLSNKLNEIKSDTLRRFKHLKFLELNEELKKTNKKEKKAIAILNADIQALKYNPKLDGENLASLGKIESDVRALIGEIEEKEISLMHVDRQSSMLCELNIINLTNFLKHFNAEIDFDDLDDACNVDENKSEMKDENNKNKEMIRGLNERCFFLEHTLEQKVSFIFNSIKFIIYLYLNRTKKLQL